MTPPGWFKHIKIQNISTSVSGMRRRLEHWKQRLGNRGDYPELWGELDQAIAATSELERKIISIQREQKA